MTFRTFVLWVHISTITLWLGGLFAVSFVLVPVLSRKADEGGELVRAALQRFMRISREIIFLVFLSGIFNIILAGMVRNFEFGPVYMRIVTAKFALFIAIIVIQALQTVKLGPVFETGGAAEVAQARKRFYLSSLLALTLGITVIMLGLRLQWG